MRTLRASRPPPSVAGEPQGGAGPVLLATLGVPLDPAAMRFAVDAAVESGRPLVVANVVELPPSRCRSSSATTSSRTRPRQPRRWRHRPSSPVRSAFTWSVCAFAVRGRLPRCSRSPGSSGRASSSSARTRAVSAAVSAGRRCARSRTRCRVSSGSRTERPRTRLTGSRLGIAGPRARVVSRGGKCYRPVVASATSLPRRQ